MMKGGEKVVNWKEIEDVEIYFKKILCILKCILLCRLKFLYDIRERGNVYLIAF